MFGGGARLGERGWGADAHTAEAALCVVCKTHTHTLHYTQYTNRETTPVGWAGSKQEAGQPERGILVSPGLVSFGGTSE